MRYIKVKGARENNLKNIDVTIPRDKMVVFTGLSGSGKSSLAFDTLYAEGQRRYVESLSSYARMFLGQMEKPDVDEIEGMSPAISIDQKTTSKNPRSTVGTVTEIYDYMRLLFARIGKPHCPKCGREISQQTVDQIVDRIAELPEGTKINILAPVVRNRKGEYQKLFEDASKSGFVRVRVDGIMYDLMEKIPLEKNKKHNIEIVVDRLVIRDGVKRRLSESVETALHNAKGLCIAQVIDGEELLFSQNYSCPDHDFSIEELNPRMFSFNAPFGACATCDGIGYRLVLDMDLVIPNKNLSINEGAIKASGWASPFGDAMSKMYYRSISREYGIDLDMPIKDMPREHLDIVLYGNGGKKIKMERTSSTFGKVEFDSAYEGVIPNLERRFKETNSDYMRREIEALMRESHCPDCGGRRLNKNVLAVTVGDKNISEVCDMSVTKALEFFASLSLSDKDKMISERVIKEINARLDFLKNVGLDYLTLSRSAGTLSGGESQRIRLATQIGSGLTGVVYILDEPSIGLHQRDNDKLIATASSLWNMTKRR